MINGRLCHPKLTLLLALGFIATGLGAGLPLSGQINLAPVYRATPDPYFNPKQQINQGAIPVSSPTSSMPRSSLLKPIQENDHPRISVQRDFTPPTVDSGVGIVPSKNNNQSVWEPPRLRPTSSFPQALGSSVPGSENSLKQETENQGVDSPVGSSSIIRQPQVADPLNRIPSAVSTKPLTPLSATKEQEYSADLSRLQRPFEVVSGTKVANPFFDPADNQAAKNNPPVSEIKEQRAAMVDVPDSSPRTFSVPDKPPTGQPQFSVQAGFDADAPSLALPKPAEAAEQNVSLELESRKPPEREFFEPTRLLARVGDQPIFLGDLMFDINQLIERVIPTAPPDIKKREMQKAIPIVLNKHVEQALIYVDTLQKLPEQVDINNVLEQAGKEFDTKAVLEMADQAGVKSSTEYDALLRIQGSSLRKLRLAWSKEQIARYFLMQELDSIDEITHQELLKEYHRRRDEYAVPAKARWEEIVIRFDRAGSKKEAEQMVVDLKHKIIYGANFASVAKSSSHGFTAADGGVHDWTSRGALVHQAIDQALFSLPQGELSDKIQTSMGYHIIRVLERTEAHHRPFTEVQSEIKADLEDQKREANFQKHMQSLKDRIEVEYFLGTDLDNPLPGGN